MLSNKSGTLSSFFSGVDDASELGFPGLHATFGGFGQEKGFQIAASVVHMGKRYCISAFEVFEGIYNNKITYHKNVDAQIVEEVHTYQTVMGNLNYKDYNDIIYKRYTDNNSKLYPAQIGADKRHSNMLFDNEIEDLSEELFFYIAEAEALGFITVEESTEYMDNYDTEVNSLRKDSSICVADKIVILEDYCKRVAEEIKRKLERSESYE